MPQVEVFRDRRDEYRWRLVADDGKSLATGGEGFVDKASVLEAVGAFLDAAKSMSDNADAQDVRIFDESEWPDRNTADEHNRAIALARKSVVDWDHLDGDESPVEPDPSATATQ
ncbi:MAG: DUF1508 domain-containing protein [Planctomycetota bacterium]